MENHILIAVLFLIFLSQFFYYYDYVNKDVLFQSNWGGNNGCLPFYEYAIDGKHAVTDVCQCKYNSWVYKKLSIDSKYTNLNLEACSDYSGGDGLEIFVYIDQKKISNITLSSNSCISKNINLNGFADSKVHIINLTSNSFGMCIKEFTIWKKAILN